MRISRSVLFIAVGLLLAAFVLSRVRIVLFVPMSLGTAILLFGGVLLVLFLVLDHLVNRDRD